TRRFTSPKIPRLRNRRTWKAGASAFPSGRRPRESTCAACSPTSTASTSPGSSGSRRDCASREGERRSSSSWPPEEGLKGNLAGLLIDVPAKGARAAVMSARGGRGARLFNDYRTAEAEYWRKTRIFPIMHVLVLKREVYERDRWIAMNLFQAFS